MSERPNYETALERLKLAWTESMVGNNTNDALALFHGKVRDILDETQLTKAWVTDELSGREAVLLDEISRFEQRGPLKYMQPFRQAFWKRNVAGLLSASVENGAPLIGRAFWRDEFPETWCRDAAKEFPPISPSGIRPDSKPYAKDPDYQDWVNGPYRERIRKLHPGFSTYLDDMIYNPEDPSALKIHAWILSGVSALIMSDKLGLIADADATPEIVKYLSDNGDLKFRYRKQEHVLWPPGDKRPYVDLNLSSIYAQVLIYQEDDWLAPHVARSLALREGGTTGNEEEIKHTNLIRVDLELASWCEIASRWVARTSPALLASAECHGDAQRAMTAFDHLLPHQVQWAKTIIEKAKELAAKTRPGQTRDGSGLFTELFHRQSGWQLDDGVDLLPPSRTTPVLEDGELLCHLDWNWIAPEGDWMDLRLIVLTAEGREEYLEYDETTPEDASDDDPTSFRMAGTVWERLKRDYSEDALRAGFGKTLFGRRISELGTGAFVLGLIDLSNIGIGAEPKR